MPDPLRLPDVTVAVAWVGPMLLPDHVSKAMLDGVLNGTLGTLQVSVFACVSTVGSPKPVGSCDADLQLGGARLEVEAFRQRHLDGRGAVPLAGPLPA